MNRWPRILPALLVWTLLGAAACAPPVPPPPPLAEPASTAASAPERARQQLAAHVRAGRHQAALAFIEQERRSSGSPRLLEEESLQVLTGLSKAAEEFFRAGHYERSGRSLRLLLEHYPQERTAATRLGIRRQELQDRLELCAERLMAQGMADYRAGNLPAAIESWKKVLTFQEGHDGAKKGIRTAEIQLKNLRALP